MKVREHLVSLLNASGLRVGLPKSPSVNVLIGLRRPVVDGEKMQIGMQTQNYKYIFQVIFSQSSHEIAAELPSSLYSSNDDLPGGDFFVQNNRTFYGQFCF